MKWWTLCASRLSSGVLLGQRLLRNSRTAPVNLQRRVLLGAVSALIAVLAGPPAPAQPVRAGDEKSCRAEAPLKLRHGMPFVTLLVDNRPRNFILDTGGFTVVNRDRVALPQAGLKEVRTTVTLAGSEDGHWQQVKIKSLTIGSVTMTGVQVVSTSLQNIEAAVGREVDGILGNDFLTLWKVVDIDYQHGKLVLKTKLAICDMRPMCPYCPASDSVTKPTLSLKDAKPSGNGRGIVLATPGNLQVRALA
jgi:hypothetical protein